jgi:prepilin-type N-terminal cleavage/methylation domain-containing protein
MKNKGFTLIELLVVIAVLGILATLIITNLSKSRDEAKQTAVIAEIQGLKTSVEIETGASGNYTDICNLFDAGEKLAMVRESIESKGGIWTSCTSDVSSYAVIVEFDSAVVELFDVKQAYAQATVEPRKAQESNIKDPIKGGVAASGVHHSNDILISPKGLKLLKNQLKQDGETFQQPKYYCMGAAPSTSVNKGGYLEGFMYELGGGGCGSYLSDNKIYQYYADSGFIHSNPEELENQIAEFMSSFNNCSLTTRSLNTGIKSGWITRTQALEYENRCATDEERFWSSYDGCELTLEELNKAVDQNWITEAEIEDYNSNCN